MHNLKLYPVKDIQKSSQSVHQSPVFSDPDPGSGCEAEPHHSERKHSEPGQSAEGVQIQYKMRPLQGDLQIRASEVEGSRAGSFLRLPPLQRRQRRSAGRGSNAES